MALSRSVPYQPPCTVPCGLQTLAPGVPSKRTRPWATSSSLNPNTSAIGGAGNCPSRIACMTSRPDSDEWKAASVGWAAFWAEGSSFTSYLPRNSARFRLPSFRALPVTLALAETNRGFDHRFRCHSVLFGHQTGDLTILHPRRSAIDHSFADDEGDHRARDRRQKHELATGKSARAKTTRAI